MAKLRLCPITKTMIKTIVPKKEFPASDAIIFTTDAITPVERPSAIKRE